MVTWKHLIVLSINYLSICLETILHNHFISGKNVYCYGGKIYMRSKSSSLVPHIVHWDKHDTVCPAFSASDGHGFSNADSWTKTTAQLIVLYTKKKIQFL